MNTKTLVIAALSLAAAGQSHAQIASAITSSPDLNVTSYTNVWDDKAGDALFTAGGLTGNGSDAFNIAQVGVSAGIPFAVLDDSGGVFAPDTAGIIDSASDFDPFFAITDTVNADTTGPVIATWVFDISSAASDVEVSLDLAAMGDFEADDSFIFSIGLDGGGLTQVASLTADEANDAFEYELLVGQAEPATILADPLTFNGTTTLNNVLTTFSLGTIAGSASASTLTLELAVEANGGAEGVVFRNIIIEEATAPTLLGDTDGDGDVDDSDLGTSFSNYTGPLAFGVGGKTADLGDTDGDGDVDDSDLGTSFSNYTGPLEVAVPEPTSLALLGLGGLLAARRRRV